MKKILIACGLALLPPLALAIDISVGETQLSIPAPAGFSPVTSDMKPYAELATRLVPPSNEQFALFLPSADTAIAARGEIPVSERKFSVQTIKEMIRQYVSAADFAELKRILKTQNEEILKKAEAQMPGLLEKMNKSLSDAEKVDLNLSVVQMLPFPPHYETERGMAYSMLIRYSMNDENGKPSVFEGVVTTTFVHVRGKVLFLYANAEKSGLSWSKAESGKWAERVIAANPSVGVDVARETTRRRSGFDWGEIVEKTIVGAVIGGVVGLIAYLFGKWKN